MKYDTVIFDLDGTLINTLGDLTASTNYALAAFGFPPVTVEQVRGFVGNGVARLIHLALPAGTSAETEKKCLAVFKEHYKTHSAVLTAPYDGIDDTLLRIKEIGVKTAVVTNKMEEAAVSIVRSFFGSNIDVVIGQVDGLKQKPEPDGVFKAIELLGADISRCVYVGDSEVDCATAKNAGLPIIGCEWGFRDRKTLEDNSADYIISSPDEIIDCIL